MKSVKSIHRYLLVSLTLALFFVSVLITILTYLSATYEINELYDENLKEISDTLKNQFIALNLEEVRIQDEFSTSLEQKLSEEQEFLVQIWDQSHALIYTSHRAIPFPLHEANGIETVYYQGEEWRTYSSEADSFIIQVSQSQNARIEYAQEMSLYLLCPILLLIPLMGILMWFAVSKSLAPLNDISLALTKRSATSLEPLMEINTPSEIKPLVQELNELLKRLSLSLETKKRFTADAAHQLRTPLTALQLQLGNLKRAKSDSERECSTYKIEAGIQRLTHMVQQLLTLASVETAMTEIEKSMVDLNSLAQEVISHHLELAIEKNIDLELSDKGNVILYNNVSNIRIILENLLCNALRYTPSNGKVNIVIYEHEEKAMIEVQDNGIGIPLEERKKIFDRFYRILGTNVEGTGLGLSIIKHIIEQSLGTISIGEGISGKGVSFIISLPIK